MKWICYCYGSTEARSFPGSIITLPSFDEKTFILDSIDTISIDISSNSILAIAT